MTSPVPAQHFPVAHSILDSDALGARVADHFRLPGPIGCEVLNRGMKDVYTLTSGSTRFAVLVRGAGLQADEEIRYELGLLAALQDAGVPVAFPLHPKDREPFFAVDAPEGRRQVTVLPWVEGQEFSKVPSYETAVRVGATVARLHLAGQQYKPAKPRKVGYQRWIPRNAPKLFPRLRDRPADEDFYRRAIDVIVKKLMELETQLPYGAVHGDPHHNNVFVRTDGSFHFLDFDNCGETNLLHDVACFLWATSFMAANSPSGKLLDDSLNTAFLQGYESVRPLLPEEKAAIPLFSVAKEINMLGFNSVNVKVIGPRYLQTLGWDWFARNIRQHFADAGLSL